jgi:glycosyltransferase involved in cell wall biosynthesis
MNPSVLLLAPSAGLGGGIERYVATVEAALQARSVAYQRINLVEPGGPTGWRAKLRFVSRLRGAVRGSAGPVRLVLAHGFLAPVVRLVAWHRNVCGVTVILHGDHEIWGSRRVRGGRTLRRDDVRVVAVSNFSAGALAHLCRASVLHPGVSPQWYDTLTTAGDRRRASRDGLVLVTSFRLQSWRSKGLGELVEAIQLLADRRVRLTVCGSGPVPADLQRLVSGLDWCRLLPDLPDRALAEQFADADLFVLATRTRSGAQACGEGFGLVLLEAQLAGTAVLAPAYGGSAEAFLPGVTGLSPLDESAPALAAVLGDLLADRQRLAGMGQVAAQWARSRFEPVGYGRQITRVLLGDAPLPDSRPASGQSPRAGVAASG